jgi:hypothetical protein
MLIYHVLFRMLNFVYGGARGRGQYISITTTVFEQTKPNSSLSIFILVVEISFSHYLAHFVVLTSF